MTFHDISWHFLTFHDDGDGGGRDDDDDGDVMMMSSSLRRRRHRCRCRCRCRFRCCFRFRFRFRCRCRVVVVVVVLPSWIWRQAGLGLVALRLGPEEMAAQVSCLESRRWKKPLCRTSVFPRSSEVHTVDAVLKQSLFLGLGKGEGWAKKQNMRYNEIFRLTHALCRCHI